MPKGSSGCDPRRPVLLDLLVETRTKAKLTQAELAEAAGVSQPYVSQVESGLIRLDGLQLVDWVHACGSDLGRFGRALEKRLEAARRG
jgi:transcriptional regulator with XRE-family HTH domain